MGNVAKKCANAALSFFGKVSNFVSNSARKVAEIVVNGVRKVVNFFKQVIEYSWEGIKIVGKLFYCLGRQIIHTMTGKEGIPHLIEFYNELINKNVIVKDENNNEINPQNYFQKASESMEEGDQIKIKTEIIKKNGRNQEEMFEDFTQNDDMDDILGLNIKESTAHCNDGDISMDNISQAETNSE